MIVTILIFVAVLALLILVHEFGHFITARFFKVHVEEFGIGFPPRIKAFATKITTFSLNWIPAGGFVKLKGEQGDHTEDEDSFSHKSTWKRSIILLAGVTMNVILAAFIFSAAFMIGMPKAVEDNVGPYASVSNTYVQVVSVSQDSPAADAQLKSGDVIISINNQTPTSTEDIKNITQANLGNQISITYEREKQRYETTATPKILPETPDRPTIGISTVAIGKVSYPFFVAIWMGIKETGYYLWLIIQSLWGMLANLVAHEPVSGDVVGPIGVAVMTGKFAKLGFIYLLQFTALISLNLAIVNVLPIPALDGGRLFFLLLEKIKGSPVNQKTEAIIHNVGFIVILLLIGFITIRDIFQIDKINSLF